ncbi:MAG: SET domain-containing protein-lysine N-methyltransferase [Betaproteobacteria bacterium]|nr:SET domain-containing protein-lysine N-methyltransferase [Betaproteobacteria bacterium]
MSRKQRRGRRRFAVRHSTIHGRGVFALARIRKGGRIVEYTGERITSAEVDRRYGDEDDYSPHTMLFCVEEDDYIDATRAGNSARWINHSCSPNCEAVDEEGRIYIEAVRGIRPGEELTYDYNLFLDERHTPAAKRAHPCCCGSRRCRGTMLKAKR